MCYSVHLAAASEAEIGEGEAEKHEHGRIGN